MATKKDTLTLAQVAAIKRLERRLESLPSPAKGDTGPAGKPGPQGAPGPQGKPGERGPEGPKGSKGPQGPKGNEGKQGPTGKIGPRGRTGPAGAQGPAGEDGNTIYSGTKPPTADLGREGDFHIRTEPLELCGPKTRSGWPTPIRLSVEDEKKLTELTVGGSLPGSGGGGGFNGAFSIGTVTTTAPGTDATVTDTGTNGDIVLNFGIPRGDTGLPGNAATITIGSVTTGAAGTNAVVTNSGTSSAAILNFTIPQGEDGNFTMDEILDEVRTDAANTTFTYTNGQLTGSSNADVSKTFTYNQNGTLATATIVTTAKTITKTFSYNSNGLSSITVT